MREFMERYSRQIMLPQIGLKGQKKLSTSRVLVIGAGGLGSSALMYLVASGIGNIGIVDDDLVELSNLSRQVIHGDADIARPKVESALKTLKNINKDVRIEIYREWLCAANIEKIFANYDVVVEGSDNLQTKFLVNDACVKLDIPLVIAGILRFFGQSMSILPSITPCYACVFNSPVGVKVQNCASAGVMGAVAGVFGAFQASEAIKILLTLPVFSGLVSMDLLSLSLRKIPLMKDIDCPTCAHADRIQLQDYPPEISCWRI